MLSLSNCASDPVQIPEDIQNIQWCHPFLNGTSEIGASCDNFLTSNPQLLDAAGWQKLMQIWLSQGGIPECTTSKSMTALKVLVENVCSQYPCSYEQQALVSQIRDGLTKIESLGVN